MVDKKKISINRVTNFIEGYYLLKMYDEALKEIENLLAIDKNNLLGYYYRGLIYLEKKEYHSALQPFLRVCELRPELAETYVHLAYIYRRIEGLEKAIEVISKALSIRA